MRILLRFFVLVSIIGWPHLSRADLVAEIANSHEAAIVSAEKPLVELERKYAEALEKLKASVQSGGNLEGVVLIQKEIENFGKEADRDFSSLPELERLRGIFEKSSLGMREEIARKQNVILGENIEKLAKLKAELTKAGEIEEALRADDLRKAFIDQRSKIANAESGSLLATEPVSLLWSLGSRADFELIKECEAKHEDDTWVLTSEVKAMSHLSTDKEFQPPFSAHFRATTDQVEIRFFWDGSQIVIFNWSSNPQQLRFQNPVDGKATGVQEKGYLEPATMHDIEIRVTATKIEAFVDGELRGELVGDWGSLEGPFGIGPAFGSTVTVEKFEVHALELESR